MKNPLFQFEKERGIEHTDFQVRSLEMNIYIHLLRVHTRRIQKQLNVAI